MPADAGTRLIGATSPRARAPPADNPQSARVLLRMAAGADPTSLWGEMHTTRPAAVDLHWIPLGAGGRCVRLNGRAFEAIAAARQRRPRRDLYHAVLVVDIGDERHTIELAPSPDGDGASRGVVATGAVGSRQLGRLRWFRYEVRCWRDGCIPDLGAAVGGPIRLTSDAGVAGRVLDLAAIVPVPVWGRDALHAGEMWNSNSVIAWIVAAAGLPAGDLRPPAGGRAPGWDAGLEAPQRIGSGPRRPSPRARRPRRWPAVR